MPLALGGRGHGDDVHVAARQPPAVREDAPAAKCRSTRCVAHAREKAAAARAGHRGVPHQRSGNARRPRCCTVSSTTRCCTRSNVILTIETADTPRVDPAERVQHRAVGETFSRVVLRFGFMETPNVPKALAIARKHGWQFDIMSTSFFLSRRALKPAAHSGMPRWQDRLFIVLDADRPTTPPTISRSRPGGWWRSAPR